MTKEKQGRKMKEKRSTMKKNEKGKVFNEEK